MVSPTTMGRSETRTVLRLEVFSLRTGNGMMKIAMRSTSSFVKDLLQRQVKVHFKLLQRNIDWVLSLSKNQNGALEVLVVVVFSYSFLLSTSIDPTSAQDLELI